MNASTVGQDILSASERATVMNGDRPPSDIVVASFLPPSPDSALSSTSLITALFFFLPLGVRACRSPIRARKDWVDLVEAHPDLLKNLPTLL